MPQNLQENTQGGFSFLCKVCRLAWNFLKKETITQMFCHKLCKIFETNFFIGYLQATTSEYMWHLTRLVLFVRFKKSEKTHRGVLLLVKLQALVYNFIKSNTPLWMFSCFLKLYRRYQILRSVSFRADKTDYPKQFLCHAIYLKQGMLLESNGEKV